MRFPLLYVSDAVPWRDAEPRIRFACAPATWRGGRPRFL